VKENQERRNASGLEGTRQKLCKVAEEFRQKIAEKVDQLTVQGEPEETEDDTD
jgi:hypothetical protein